MLARVLVVGCLLAVLGLAACAPFDPLVGKWAQIAEVGSDGARRPPATQAMVLELHRGGKAVLFDGETTEFTWDVSDDRRLRLKGHPGWEVREVFELRYELDGDVLTTDWPDGGPRRVFERR